MKTIKFSHDSYLKFGGTLGIVENGEVVELIGVSVYHSDLLSRDFINYDTNFGTEETPEYYPLPNGKLIVLFFFAFGMDIFSTIRRWTPQKEEYYRASIGKEFEVVITKVLK